VDLCCIHVTGVSVPYRNAMMLWSWIGDLTMYQRRFYRMWMVFYKPEDDPKGLKHVATLIVYSLTLHHIVV